ncbi:hypothetical protein PHYBOEH_004465 [Phytophthora boehmeriae]|uniref:Uncharacterized protein n=1 Tax=Phytophthora boehmeriae TaxID=109152 RepID=A0A8T1WRE0_9STRA|nr:hypothetical protein PHYBOEH_004465 [Phytophthora boehmeriae]
MPSKKRKATYLVRKEERESLQTQIQTLQQQLQTLQHDGATQRQDLDASVGQNAALRDAVDQQHFAVAGAQSLLSELLQSQKGNPMGMRIHLGREWTARRETLLAMKDERLARGFRYVTARCQHLAPLKPQFSEERFEDANGDFCCIRNEVVPFPGVESLKKVFDAVRFTVDTLEITISEQLGHITLRDDYDAVDDGSFVTNYRLTSKLDCGVTAELNNVAFGQYMESGIGFNEQRCAVVAIDSVDQDDLYPYHPHECLQKTIHGTLVLIPVTRKKACRPCKQTNSLESATDETSIVEDEKEVVIVMLRSFVTTTRRPHFEISEIALQELRDNATRWGNVVLQAIRRIIYS